MLNSIYFTSSQHPVIKHRDWHLTAVTESDVRIQGPPADGGTGKGVKASGTRLEVHASCLHPPEASRLLGHKWTETQVCCAGGSPPLPSSGVGLRMSTWGLKNSELPEQ